MKAGLILGCALIIFFSPSLFGGKIPSGCGVLQWSKPFQVEGAVALKQSNLSDACFQFEPWLRFSRRVLWDGQIPLWNPHQGNGTPHIANMQSSFYFPLSWIVFIVGVERGVVWLYFLKLFFIGLFCYLYLRQVGTDHRAAVICSLAFMFGGFNVSWLYWPSSNAILFLPLSLFLLEKILERPSNLAYYSLFALSLAVALVAGHLETVTYILVLNLVYGGFRLFSVEVGSTTKLWVALCAAGAVVVGGFAASVQLFPLKEYLENSTAYHRGLSLFYFPEYQSLRAFYFALNFVPDLFGNYSLANRYFLPIHSYQETATGYVGLSMLFFAFLALVKVRCRQVWLYASVAALFLAIAYGFPVVARIFASLPVISSSRLHLHRTQFIYGFMVTALASVLLSRVFEGALNLRAKGNVIAASVFFTAAAVISAVAIISAYPLINDPATYRRYLGILAVVTALNYLAVLVIVWCGRAKYLPAIVGLVVFIETGVHGIFQPQALDPKLVLPDVPVIRVLNENLGHQRVLSLLDGPQFPPNIATAYGLYDVRNYDSLVIRSHVEALNRYGEISDGARQPIVRLDREYVDLAGVKYILVEDADKLTRALMLTDAEKEEYVAVFTGEGFRVFENPRAYPRAFFVQQAGLAAERLLSSHVMRGPGIAALIQRYEPGTVVVETRHPSGGYLVLTDSYFPGWRVFVDREPRELLKVKSTNFRAVYVEGGAHTVTFEYVPESFYRGGLLSFGSMSLIALGFLAHWRGYRVPIAP